MRSLVAALTTVALLALVAPAAAGTRACSNTYGGDVVSATNLTCRSAHKLINAWARKARRTGEYDRTQFGFRCRNRPSSAEGDTMRCRRGNKSVRWYVNLPR